MSDNNDDKKAKARAFNERIEREKAARLKESNTAVIEKRDGTKQEIDFSNDPKGRIVRQTSPDGKQQVNVAVRSGGGGRTLTTLKDLGNARSNARISRSQTTNSEASASEPSTVVVVNDKPVLAATRGFSDKVIAARTSLSAQDRFVESQVSSGRSDFSGSPVRPDVQRRVRDRTKSLNNVESILESNGRVSNRSNSGRSSSSSSTNTVQKAVPLAKQQRVVQGLKGAANVVVKPANSAIKAFDPFTIGVTNLRAASAIRNEGARGFARVTSERIKDKDVQTTIGTIGLSTLPVKVIVGLAGIGAGISVTNAAVNPSAENIGEAVGSVALLGIAAAAPRFVNNFRSNIARANKARFDSSLPSEPFVGPTRATITQGRTVRTERLSDGFNVGREFQTSFAPSRGNQLTGAVVAETAPRPVPVNRGQTTLFTEVRNVQNTPFGRVTVTERVPVRRPTFTAPKPEPRTPSRQTFFSDDGLALARPRRAGVDVTFFNAQRSVKVVRPKSNNTLFGDTRGQSQLLVNTQRFKPSVPRRPSNPTRPSAPSRSVRANRSSGFFASSTINNNFVSGSNVANNFNNGFRPIIDSRINNRQRFDVRQRSFTGQTFNQAQSGRFSSGQASSFASALAQNTRSVQRFSAPRLQTPARGSSFSNRFKPVGRFNIPKGGSSRSKSFTVISRVKGREVKIASGKSLGEAFRIGKSFTGSTSARSFKIVDGFGTAVKKGAGLGFSRGVTSKTKDFFVESSRRAINTSGELREITFKGVRSSRGKKSGRRL